MIDIVIPLKKILYSFSLPTVYVLFYFFVTDDGYLETETTKLNILNSTKHMTVDTTISLIEKPLQNSELNITYLLAGVGVFMSMVLFIILIASAARRGANRALPARRV